MTNWNDFELALLMYIWSREMSWTLRSIWMNAEAACLGLQPRRHFAPRVSQPYEARNHEKLSEIWGQDGEKAKRYLDAVDGILAVMNIRGEPTGLISQEEVSSSVDDSVEELAES